MIMETTVDLLLSISAALIGSGCILQVWAFFLFKSNQRKFDFIMSEFQRINLQIDITTQVANHFPSLFHHNKVSYFARLYKGVTMYHKKNERVGAETYNFVQNLPSEKIKWLLIVHNLNLISALLLFLGAVTILIYKRMH